ncbi:metal ABC transporter solute-binding protein, Zn/Mn family [Glaciihabitans sp. INWT7]|uniref:metal ABC transporter solute-binding protein, Zn/Mn family n=1 Tax=Glaciihabitans sp. INWT7 TaxID=2596912 RepID=UPI0021062D4C|nr:zinc ABC transporter substrate-binding protein [Glaciihabitans sp. INWT7]
MRAKIVPVLSVGILLSLALAGCSGASSPPKDDGLIHVVASTDVYGDIAKQIGGDLVSVTSIISNPSQDPHSYEADAQVQLSLSKADVVIQNGGGYDDFVDTLLKGANNPGVALVDAAAVSGHDQTPTTGEFNEHLWYDFPTVTKVATKLESTFSRLDPKNAATFAANGASFSSAVSTLESSEAAIRASASGEGAAITEPVPLYMLDAMGLVNKTPEKFSAAIEGGTDVSPLVLRETLALFGDHAVKLLAYNAQTGGPQTAQVVAAAKKAGVAVVPVRETLPAGKDYLEWMTDTVAAISAALK